MSASSCSAASRLADEPLGASATVAARWLLVEVRGAWGRDAVADTSLPEATRAMLEAFDGRVILVRRPDRRQSVGVTAVLAEVGEQSGTIARQVLGSLDALPAIDLARGGQGSAPFFLVCSHGRRDPCCARLGPPLFEALAQHLEPQRLWQASHLGGHRFAPNIVVLPLGVQLGRIPLERAAEVVELLERGRIPLDLYRGRTLYPPPVQAAELLVRSVSGCDGVHDLTLLSHDGDVVTFTTPSGDLAARVETRVGPAIAPSCGAEPEPTSGWAAALQSSA